MSSETVLLQAFTATATAGAVFTTFVAAAAEPSAHSTALFSGGDVDPT
jgi:hypothetical protein